MTQSYSGTEAWTRTNARKVAGKVAADLRGMQQAYGLPSDKAIEDYTVELTEFLAGGHVQEVSYGFMRDGKWIAGAALKYTADMNGDLATDDRSGKIPRGADITGAEWHSFLSYSEKWNNLSATERESVRNRLPFRRTAGAEPAGLWLSDKTYSSAGCGVRRATAGGSA